MGPFSKMTKGLNYVKSTLKGAYKMGGMQGVAGVGLVGAQKGYGMGKSYLKGGAGDISSAFNQMKAGARGNAADRAGGLASGAKNFHSRIGQRAAAGGRSVGSSYGRMAATAGAGAATADFLNPWGLGFGD